MQKDLTIGSYFDDLKPAFIFLKLLVPLSFNDDTMFYKMKNVPLR
jgi:hypothetical protein